MTRCVWECFQQVVSIPVMGLFQGVFLSDTEVEFKRFIVLGIPFKELIKFHQQSFIAVHAVRAALEEP